VLMNRPEPRQEGLAGLVERVPFHNADNGFSVLRVKARGHRDLVTLIGHAAAISAGEWLIGSGEWINDRTHGQQFRARFLKASAPTSIEGIEKYLGSGMIRGIGPVYAKKLVRTFSDKVFDVIEGDCRRHRPVRWWGPEPLVEIGSPEGLLARFVPVGPQPLLVDGLGQFVGLSLAERFRARSKIPPPRLDLAQHLEMANLRLCRIPGVQTALFLKLANDAPKLVGDALSKPVDAGLRTLPGTRHCESHVYHPCVPLGRSNSLIWLNLSENHHLEKAMVPRDRLP
jgi:hypothetical protein